MPKINFELVDKRLAELNELSLLLSSHKALDLQTISEKIPLNLRDHPSVAKLLDPVVWQDPVLRQIELNRFAGGASVMRRFIGGAKPLHLPWDVAPENINTDDEILGFRLISIIRPSLVAIFKGKSSFIGSGVVVEAKSINTKWKGQVLVTAAHVVEPGFQLFPAVLNPEDAVCKVTQNDGQLIRFKLGPLKWADDGTSGNGDELSIVDVAIFEIDVPSIRFEEPMPNQGEPQLQSAKTAAARVGGLVFPAGYGRSDNDDTELKTLISVDVEGFRKIADIDRFRIKYRASTEKGMSGGPILNKAGAVVGIHHGDWIAPPGAALNESANAGTSINGFKHMTS
jgi:hypothetical protein